MRRPAFLLRLLAIALALGCASPEERFAAHLERADGYLEEGRSAEALIELQSALKIQPEDADLNQRLGDLLAERGTLPAAAFHYGEAYRLDPSRVDAAMRQAALIWRTAPRRSEQIIAEARERHPDDPRVYRGESGLAVAARDPQRAIAAAQRAIELAPDDPENYAQLGSAHAARVREKGREKQPVDGEAARAGIDAFEKVDEMTGGHVGARIEKARLYERWPGHHDEAVAAFRSALELARERKDDGARVFAAQKMLGFATRQKSLPLRIEALRELVDAAPSAVAQWDALARAVEFSEGIDAAGPIYEELIREQPDLPAAHVTYSIHLSRTGRDLDAIAHLDKVISDGLDDPVLWEQLLRLELGQRRLADARATLDEMQERHEDEVPTRRSEARLLMQEGKDEEAIAILSELAAEDDSPETERLRALAEMNAGNLTAAQASIERALALARGDVSSLRLKATIDGESEQWQSVLRTLSVLERRGWDLTPQEQLLRARAHYQTGDAEAGRTALVASLSSQFPPPAAAVEFSKREAAQRPAEARAYLEKVLRLAPGNYPALEEITLLDLRESRVQPALARLDKLVESQLAGPQVLLLRAQLLTGAGQLDRAEADALRAFEAAPDLEGAVDVLYSIYVRQGKLAEARRSFEEADSVGVLHNGARVLLGRLYLAEGKADQAMAMYEKVLAQDPSMTAAKGDLAFLLATRGQDLERALSYAEEAQKAMPDNPTVADTVGYVYYRMGRHEAALQQFRYALEIAESLGGSIPTVNYHLGLTLSALSRPQEAAAAFEKALSLDANFQGADDARRQLEAARRAQPEAKSPS